VANIEINEGNNDDALSIVLKSVRYNNSLADSCASLLMNFILLKQNLTVHIIFLKNSIFLIRLPFQPNISVLYCLALMVGLMKVCYCVSYW